MLRVALTDATRTLRAARSPLVPLARYQSSKPTDEQALKAAHKLNDKLQQNWKGPVLTYEQLKPKTLSPSNDAYLVDVREPDEVMQGSIPSSVNLPLSVLANSLNLNALAFRTQHGFEKPGISQEIVFYCRSGKRSASACDIARRNGYDNVINYEGSWLDWVSREGGGKSSSA